ncbi:MAG: hypothetical protein DHS80DRAFT_23692 [Piptocephalis tieghemiana]|nr:MAG: hypothetical protein DHS80DRAFT_23692 [Piptocephalis tieghemiana]
MARAHMCHRRSISKRELSVIVSSPATLLWSDVPALCNDCEKTGHTLTLCRQCTKGAGSKSCDPFVIPHHTGLGTIHSIADASSLDRLKNPPSQEEQSHHQVEPRAPSPKSLPKSKDATISKTVEVKPTAPHATVPPSRITKEKAEKIHSGFNCAALLPSPKKVLKDTEKIMLTQHSDQKDQMLCM